MMSRLLDADNRTISFMELLHKQIQSGDAGCGTTGLCTWLVQREHICCGYSAVKHYF